MTFLTLVEGRTSLPYRVGYHILGERGLAVVGMSPGNSHFDRSTINDLLQLTSSAFSQVRVMIADHPAIHTYRALGCDEIKAARKARLSGNTLRNHCGRSIAGINEHNPRADVAVIGWEDTIIPSAAYQRELADVVRLYDTNDTFWNAVNEETTAVLAPKMKAVTPTAVREGATYLLKEIAFLLAAPTLFHVPRVAYVYHKDWNVVERLLNGDFDRKERDTVGMVMVR